MKRESPNPRLQRTPLRAPLSRKPLGAGSEAARSGAVGHLVVATSLFIGTGCHLGPTLAEYRQLIRKTAGNEAVDCGLVLATTPREPAVACSTSAMTNHQPFFVAFQVRGIDSQIIVGVAVDRAGRATKMLWDSDAYGGGRWWATKSWMQQAGCRGLSVSADENPIRCNPANPGA
jgi:hypothetical protein